MIPHNYTLRPLANDALPRAKSGAATLITGHSPLTAHRLSLILSLFSLLTVSCSSIDCPVKNTVAVYYEVTQLNADGDLVPDTLTDTLWVWSQRSDGRDTLLNSLVGQSSFSLPISYQHPEDVLIFAISDTAHYVTLDTVWLKKDDIPHFESVDCAAHYFHQLTGVRCTSHGLDSVAIRNASVTYADDVTNISIFLKDRPWLTSPTLTPTTLDETEE